MYSMIRELTTEETRMVYSNWMKVDFPPAELKPLSVIEKCRRKGQYICYGYFEEKELLAYAFWVESKVKGKTLCLFDYFAVRSDKRGTGIGSACLKELGEKAGKYDLFVVEVEDPSKADNDEQRIMRDKRLSFYLANGLKDSNCFGQAWGVDYKLLYMGKNEKPTSKEIKEAYFAFYKTLLPFYLVLTKIKFWTN